MYRRWPSANSVSKARELLPDPLKPALQFYGEVLLDAGRSAEAAAAFEQELLRTPERTPSVEGLARAAAKGGAQATVVEK